MVHESQATFIGFVVVVVEVVVVGGGWVSVTATVIGPIVIGAVVVVVGGGFGGLHMDFMSELTLHRLQVLSLFSLS